MVKVTIKDKNFKVNSGTNLLDFLIAQNYLNGDNMCKGQGNCGLCTVMVTDYDCSKRVKSCKYTIDRDIIVSFDNSYYSDFAVVENDINLGIALDIGTTTLTFEMYDLADKTLICKKICDNPQIQYGSDIMSRINAVVQGNDLRKLIINEIKNFARGYKINRMIVSANTVMSSILGNFDLSKMLTFPMVADKNAKTMFSFYENKLPNIKNITLVYSIGEFFGSDAILGLSQIDLKQNSIFVDLGTNSEIALITKDKIITSSTSAGSALLGKYQGSELIEIIADLALNNKVDTSGKLLFEDAELQKYIREYQLFKGAINAGIELIKSKYFENEIFNKIYLAGSFGGVLTNKIIKNSKLFNKDYEIEIIGNTAIQGASELLLDPKFLLKLNKIKNKCDYINLIDFDNFNDVFVEEMRL